MPKRMTEAERQVKILEALPNDATRVRVTDLVKKLRMSPRKVNIHLEKLADKGMVDFEYFPGKRAPIRLVWLTSSNDYMDKAGVSILRDDWEPDERKAPTSPSKRQKIKNKVEELLT